MRFRKIMLCITLSATSLFIGCGHLTRKQTQNKLDALYLIYLDGDNNQARRSMQESISLLENTKNITELGRATGLFMTYGRLCRIESLENNQEAALFAFNKALDCQGMILSESGVSDEEKKKDLEKCTQDGLIELINRWDSRAKEGNRHGLEEKTKSKLDVLEDIYFTGDNDQARRSIQESIGLLENDKNITEFGRASSLFAAYGRLCRVESSANNQEAATFAFNKALECQGKCMLAAGCSDEQIKKYFQHCTQESLIKLTDRCDSEIRRSKSKKPKGEGVSPVIQ